MSVCYFFIFVFCAVSPIKSADIASSEAPTSFHPDVEALLAKTTEFSTKGYVQEADDLARQITHQLIDPLTDRNATVDEINALIDVHLKTEIYYALNTKWGPGKTRDHRIIYDFLSQFNKNSPRSSNQRARLTTFTALSLAAQEYFWNEKSTVNDLKNRVKRELRYGLFSQPEHILDVSMLIHLDEASLQEITEHHINDTLIIKLKLLMEGFRAKTLGATYTEILNYIEVTSQTITTINLPVDIAVEGVIVPFGFTSNIAVKAISSCGDGMCGQHSLFIPTDGELATAESGIAEGNGRDKMHRAIFDHATDTDTKRLYLSASQHMDGFRFIDLMNKQIAVLREINADQAEALQTRMDAYKQFMQDRQTEKEVIIEQSKRVLIEKIIQLPGLESALIAFQARLNDPAACIADRNFRNIIDAFVFLRKSNPELERLLATIDSEVSKLNAEIEDAKKTAIAAAKEARIKAEENFNVLAADYQQFKNDNIELVRQHQILFSREQQLQKIIENNKRIPGAIAIDEKQIKENLAKQFKDFEEKNPEFVKSITEKHIEVTNAQKAYNSIKEDHSLRDAKLTEKYLLIITTLKDFIGINILPGKNPNAFSIEKLCSEGYSNFINDICQEICAFVGDQDTAVTCREHWDNFDNTKDLLIKKLEQQLVSQRLEIAASLIPIPEELTPHSLSLEMSEIALRPGELSDWLPCDAIYTQLWAIINNLNIFIFSEGEQFGRSKLDLIFRLSDKPYDQKTSLYPIGIVGKHLATVILTSPTAKNVFMNKSPQHYDKLILPGDYVAIAKQARHVAWAGLEEARYAPYPPKILHEQPSCLPSVSSIIATNTDQDTTVVSTVTNNLVIATDSSGNVTFAIV